MDKSLSDLDIKAQGINNIILYEDLYRVSPQQLLSMLPVAILYQPHTKDPNMGHWTLLHKVPGSVEFFDSYGFKPDQEFEVMERQQPHYIAKMLLRLMPLTTMSYSPYRFQAKDNHIATCGRWIAVRNRFSDYGIDKFAKAIDYCSKARGITGDEVVVRLTEPGY